MQIYAFDDKGNLRSAHQAVRHQDYRCLECGKIVRLRGGPQRQLHFYHPLPSAECRLSGKTQTHLAIQYFLQNLFIEDNCSLEMRFPEIRRIADVVLLPQKLIFEIQCSPISKEEILQRTRDYSSLGYLVIWILHDWTFNKHRLSLAETALASIPHYYTNFDSQGNGMIYDQYPIDFEGVRLGSLTPFPLDLRQMEYPKSSVIAKQFPSHFHKTLQYRLKNWRISFAGDLFDCKPTPALQDALKELEKNCTPFFENLRWQKKLKTFGKSFLETYRILLQSLLSKETY